MCVIFLDWNSRLNKYLTFEFIFKSASMFIYYTVYATPLCDIISLSVCFTSVFDQKRMF